jgi:hypothetical protein
VLSGHCFDGVAAGESETSPAAAVLSQPAVGRSDAEDRAVERSEVGVTFVTFVPKWGLGQERTTQCLFPR